MFADDQNLEQGIIATLAFFGLYKVPLNAEKVALYLYQGHGTRGDVKQALDKLAAAGKIYQSQGLYALRPWQPADQETHHREVGKREQKVKKFLWLLALIPFIRSLCLINSVALGSSQEESDIDFFVITAPFALYFTRTVIFVLLRSLGLYKTRSHIKDRFCFGFYVTTTHLELKDILIKPQDPYTAFWLASMRPLFGKKYYASLIRANPWIFSYLPNFNPIDHYDSLIVRPLTLYVKPVIELVCFLPALILEPLLRFVHIRHTFNLPENHWPTATTVANKTMFKLHALDPRARIREDFFRSTEQTLSV